MDSHIAHLIPTVMSIGSVTTIRTATVLIKTLFHLSSHCFIQPLPCSFLQQLTLSAPPIFSSHFPLFCLVLFLFLLSSRPPHHSLNTGVSQRQIFFLLFTFSSSSVIGKICWAQISQTLTEDPYLQMLTKYFHWNILQVLKL